jgi:aarF domain-containing kinase
MAIYRALFSIVAAASIGQVHRGKLLNGALVAIKIQYPGVSDSIESDLLNLKRLVQMTNILPPGLYIDQILKVAGTELAMECDYVLEAQSQTTYRKFILDDVVLSKHTYVPRVYEEHSTKKILTSELVPGVSIDKAVSLPQDVRNAIARTMLIMTIRELFEWRFIQSDPNVSYAFGVYALLAPLTLIFILNIRMDGA